MTANGYLQFGIYFVVLLLLVKPLGLYMAKVYQGESTFLDRPIRPLERVIYRLLGVNPDDEMDWKNYAIALLIFSAIKFPGCLSDSALAGALTIQSTKYSERQLLTCHLIQPSAL